MNNQNKNQIEKEKILIKNNEEFWDDMEEERFIACPAPKVERMSFKEMKNNFSKKPSLENINDNDSKFDSLNKKIISDKNLIHIKPKEINSDLNCVNLDYDDLIGGIRGGYNFNLKNNINFKFEENIPKKPLRREDFSQEQYMPTEQSFGMPAVKKIRNKSADPADYKVSTTLPSKIEKEKFKMSPLPNFQNKKVDKINNPNRSMIEATASKLPIPDRAGSITARDSNKNRNTLHENKIKAISKSPINVTKQKKVNPMPVQNKINKNVPIASKNPSNSNAPKIDHLNNLIQKAKEKEEKIKFLRELSEQEKITRELEGCTFKPKINNSFVPTNRAVIHERQVNTYDRHLYWNNKKEEKLEKEKQYYKIQENMECTFTPEINKKPHFIENTAPKNVDNSTKSFYQRIHNAKKLKEEQETKLRPDYNERYQKIVKGKQTKMETNGTTASGSNINSTKSEESENFGTFNPVPVPQNNNVSSIQENKTDLSSIRKTLHARLHSLEATDIKYV